MRACVEARQLIVGERNFGGVIVSAALDVCRIPREKREREAENIVRAGQEEEVVDDEDEGAIVLAWARSLRLRLINEDRERGKVRGVW